MSSNLLLLLALTAAPWDDPPAVPDLAGGGDPTEVVTDDPDARFESALGRFLAAREGWIRSGADDALLRGAWQPTWLELARAGSGRAAAFALRTRLDRAGAAGVLELYERLVAFAHEPWLTDAELDVFASLRRDAELIGRERALGLADDFLARAPDAERAVRALLLTAQLQEDGRADDPARKQRALELHREVVERFPGTPAAEESSESIWRLERLQVGKLAPDFITRDVAGNEMRLSDHTRKVVVVEFYSFSDPGIRSRMAHRRSLFERYREDRFALIGINLDADPIAFRRALEEHDVEWPNSFEGGPDVHTIWKVRRGPVFFVLDRERVIRFVGRDDAQLDAAVGELLSGAARAKATQASHGRPGTGERER